MKKNNRINFFYKICMDIINNSKNSIKINIKAKFKAKTKNSIQK